MARPNDQSAAPVANTTSINSKSLALGTSGNFSQSAYQAAVSNRAFVSGHANDLKFVLDSTATSHMICDHSIFIPGSEEELNYSIHSAKWGAEMRAVLKGNIAVQYEFGLYVITNAVFVPDLKVNLLSVSALHKNNCNVSFGTEVLLIDRNNSELISRADALENGLNIIIFKVNCLSSN